MLAYRTTGGRDQPGWRVRVVPNKFPVLGIEGDLNRQGDGMYDMNGIGAHEVIIETPNHALTIAEMPEKQIEEVLWAFKDRVSDLKKDRRFRYILLFKNHGEAAGAARTPAQPTHRPACDSWARAKGADGRGQTLLRFERAPHLLRHHPAGRPREEPGW